MPWSLRNNKGESLNPLTYSNGKTQEDVVNEVLAAIKKGHKVIFIKGQCGSGKSALALNIAKELGRASIVVPVKYLQKQYEEDYTNKLYLLKDNKEKLNIKIITGRNNHQCLYNVNCNADDRLLPCDIEIKQENFELIKAYIKNNPHVNQNDFETIDDVKRFSVAAACPYWSPIVPKEFVGESYKMPDSEAYEYEGLKGRRFFYFKRKPGCAYYDQFKSYLDADVIIFNSKKYEFETMVNRKPNTDVEIIDECDEFLDSMGNERRINLTSLQYRLRELETECKDFNMKNLLGEGRDLVEGIIHAKWLGEMIDDGEILKLKDTHIIDLVQYFLDSEDLLEYDDLEQYYEAAKSFEGLFDSTYVGFVRTKKNNVILKIVNINLEKKLHEMLEKNKTFVMMSGTIHSRKVLQEIFGIKDFVIVEAETENLGNIRKIVTKKERNFRYKEFAEGTVTREEYLRALDVCVQAAELPALVHINSFLDLPTEEEKETFGLSVISREKLQEQQEKYKHGELLQWFKEGKLKILYSTKCNRGVDFPGEMCNSIIFTKYPYPSMNSIFWKMLRQTKPEEFTDFYFDKANREFLQRIYRGLRSKHDKINILSPDIKVLKNLAK